MVTDFLHLSWLKKFFDETVDHKFIIDAHDPMFDRMIGNDNRHLLEEVYVPNTDHVAGWMLDIPRVPVVTAADIEFYESFFVVNFIPTSENLSKWAYDLASAKMSNMGVKVGEVEWWETPKSCSRYSG
jgi:6-pyruvoyltetrahydropterin/6-carboxytetrahydropterin synthase